MKRTTAIARWLAVLATAVLTACGGGGGGSDPVSPAPVSAGPLAANQLSMIVDRGPDGRAFNQPFVTVTVCAPGTDRCQTIDHVLVDTGSFGLRLTASAVSTSLALPAVTNGSGLPVAECAHFISGYTWGSVRRADVKLAGETAANLPVQLVSDPVAPYASVPAACSSTGANFGASSGLNGILGVGMFFQDCPSCAVSSASNTYFGCTDSGCASTVLPLASQVANPVPAFPADNNGVVLSLPSVPIGGVATLSGSLTFGIGTQSNNQLGAATVFTVNSLGEFTTRYKGANYTSSFLDSGSNVLFFPDPSIPQCSGFYCPPAPVPLSAVLISSTGVSASIDFTIESITDVAGGNAAANVGAESSVPGIFGWGLPFFFGRTVFVAISGAPTPKGTGPYWAF